jgi:hypothetical protein
MTDDAPEAALADIARTLRERNVAFALVGGLAAGIRGEVRFTRDVDIALALPDDAAVESLVHALQGYGYATIAVVEHEARGRLSIVRLASPTGIAVDLLAASSGIEDVVVARATSVDTGRAGNVPVARAEELLALKVLSMTERRLQDRIDATSLVLANPNLDLDAVRATLRLITERGYDRGQDLQAKLDALLADVART